jgi:diguanylate cyclase (GGDEF)-like protein
MTQTKKTKIGFFGKQLFGAVTINVITLLILSALLYSNFINDYKNNLMDSMASKVNLLADSSVSALLFDDQQSAKDILFTLEQNPSIRYAQIYDRNNQLFAEFTRPGQIIDNIPLDTSNTPFFKGNNFYSLRQIIKDNEFLGVILISANTDTLAVQKKKYILTAGILLLSSFLLACIFNWKLQQKLSAPIKDLINLVVYVAKYKRYHKRLDNKSADEVGDLILGVNAMLDTIQINESQLYERANYDELTKLPNRHLFMERLSQAIKNADRNKTEIAVLFLDLDRFKIINDSLGHSVGDQLLVQVTAKILPTVRLSDTVCRWGGDEFVLLLDNINQSENIQFVIEKIIKVLSSPNIIGNHSLHVSTSIGIACYPNDGRDAMSLLKHADISMYKAKAEGPGKFKYFNSSMLDGSVKRLTLELKVRKAFEENEFFLVYQPQLSGKTKTLVGFEALIRWKCDGKFISPEEFLPIIEEIGLMYDLSLWVLKQACEQNVSWQRAGLKPISVAVNLPASFILRPESMEKVLEIITVTGLAPEYLEVELTENTFLDARENAVLVLNSLVDLGVSIALDDFGTGYSCLAYLQYIPVKKLKIDGAFIKELGRNEANEAIVQSIIMLGKGLKMSIVAECVETEEQLSILRDMDCDVIQGYLFSKPLIADEATNFILKSQGLQSSDLATN